MKNALNSVKLVKPNSSVLDMSSDKLLSCNMGRLIPVYCEEGTPGDKWNMSQQALVRLAPLVSPMMHRCDVFFHTFSVPMRLLWLNFEKYYRGEKVGGLDPAFPYMILNDVWSPKNLCDYIGLPDPTGAPGDIFVSPMFNAAYAMIWNEYYRDQRLQPPLDFLLTDGDNTANSDLQDLQLRAWESDYFTSCLPTPQVGAAGVEVPLGAVTVDEARVLMNTAVTGGATTLTGSAGNPIVGKVNTGDPDIGVDNLYAEAQTANVAGTSITNLRLAFKLQEFLERQNVAGSRFGEFIYGMFGENIGDATIQRPVYITGSRSPVQISEVLNTTGETSASDLPQGNMAGHGISVTKGFGGYYHVKEPCIIMTLMSVMPKTNYYQGVPRKFSKITSRYEFFFNQFEHVGDQAVLNKEIHAVHATPTGTFGYSPRYMEYKMSENSVGGDFRSTLLHWHMARDLSPTVALNSDFINCLPTFRVFAVTDEADDHLYCHVYNKCFVRRLMSKYSTPRM